MKRATPSFITIDAMCGNGRKLFETGIAILAKLRVFLVALLEEHILLLPIGEGLLPREIILIDDRRLQ